MDESRVFEYPFRGWLCHYVTLFGYVAGGALAGDIVSGGAVINGVAGSFFDGSIQLVLVQGVHRIEVRGSTGVMWGITNRQFLFQHFRSPFFFGVLILLHACAVLHENFYC